jgi:hypothetical protein
MAERELTGGKLFGPNGAQLEPIVLLGGGPFLRNPTNAELAKASEPVVAGSATDA